MQGNGQKLTGHGVGVNPPEGEMTLTRLRNLVQRADAAGLSEDARLIVHSELGRVDRPASVYVHDERTEQGGAR